MMRLWCRSGRSVPAETSESYRSWGEWTAERWAAVGGTDLATAATVDVRATPASASRVRCRDACASARRSVLVPVVVLILPVVVVVVVVVVSGAYVPIWVCHGRVHPPPPRRLESPYWLLCRLIWPRVLHYAWIPRTPAQRRPPWIHPRQPPVLCAQCAPRRLGCSSSRNASLSCSSETRPRRSCCAHRS